MEVSRMTIQPAALSVAESARYLGVSEVTIRRLIRSGGIPHARVVNSIRIRLIDLDSYLASRTTTEWSPVDGRGRRAATS